MNHVARVDGPCSAEGCKRAAKARGMCDLHYQRWNYHKHRPQAKAREEIYRAARERAKIDLTPEERRLQGKAHDLDKLWQTTGGEKYRRQHHAEVDRIIASMAGRGELEKRGG